jgi:gas vesicle protein
MTDKSYGADFFAGFVVGALVGAAAAILFAPQSGEETRAMIRERSIELQERSAEMSAEARRRASEYEVQARGKAAGLQSRMKEAVDEGKAAAGEQKEDMMTGLQEQELPDETPTET